MSLTKEQESICHLINRHLRRCIEQGNLGFRFDCQTGLVRDIHKTSLPQALNKNQSGEGDCGLVVQAVHAFARKDSTVFETTTRLWCWKPGDPKTGCSEIDDQEISDPDCFKICVMLGHGQKRIFTVTIKSGEFVTFMIDDSTPCPLLPRQLDKSNPLLPS